MPVQQCRAASQCKAFVKAVLRDWRLIIEICGRLYRTGQSLHEVSLFGRWLIEKKVGRGCARSSMNGSHCQRFIPTRKDAARQRPPAWTIDVLAAAVHCLRLWHPAALWRRWRRRPQECTSCQATPSFSSSRLTHPGHFSHGLCGSVDTMDPLTLFCRPS